MILSSENFLFYILIFSSSLGLGIYALLSYQRTVLVYLSAAMFFLTAIRSCTEMALSFTDSPEGLHLLNQYNSILVHLLYTLSWYVLYFYIRPFKSFKHKKTINILVGIILLGIPNFIISYWFYNFQLVEFTDIRINGYWMFKFKNSPLTNYYYLYAYILMVGVFTSSLMIYSIITESNNRLKKTALIVVFYMVSYSIVRGFWGYSSGEWRVVNQSISMLLDSIIITWFVSGYRLITDQYGHASSDILNSLSDLIVHTDKQLNIINSNTAFKDQFGDQYSNLEILLLEKGLEGASEKITALIESKTEKSNLQVKNQAGMKMYLATKLAPYIWRNKKRGFSFIFSDVTALKQRETQLGELNETKDQLFSIIAHDLRKPVLAFRGIAKKINYLLQRQDFKSLDRLGDSIEQSALSLNTLLDNLLKWALTQKDLVKVTSLPVNIKVITDEIIEVFQIISKEKNISIDNAQVEDRIVFNNDPEIIKTIFRNVIDNALKYSPSNSTIIIKSTVTNNNLSITIRDHGIGMSPEQHTQIFKIYSNKSTIGTNGEKGSGLGLSLIHDLINKTNGMIKIQSELEKGTEVTIVYPI